MSEFPKLVVSNGACLNAALEQPASSWTKTLDRRRVRVISAELWSDFLRRNFRNQEAVAAFFEVRFQTACNWWLATNRPSADKIMIAVLELPGFLEHLESYIEVNGRKAA
ncbi:hypothetical protein [Salipiger bermudensis]|uniref:hypothetical protein n=1 Tax=Salipiger bermudensis TaxID=344736 RepID=UPI001CD2998C|nr:hypothetical protein [Salipiger bermudensis]MCA0963302.1 hypothetical protein [Salipiger bermudensis]